MSMRFTPFLVVILSGFALNPAYALDTTQQAEMLKAHNKHRTMVGVPVLNWSASLATTAQAYADKLKVTKACKPEHSYAAELGENLYWASAMIYSNGISKVQPITPTQVADSWGSEKENYSYVTNSCAAGKVCGHYTQIIWESTTEIGCGNAVCADNTQIWVCNYSPAGNFVGKKPY